MRLRSSLGDKDNWPGRERERFHIDPRAQTFIMKAMEAGRD
jgi:hypothetical protein